MRTGFRTPTTLIAAASTIFAVALLAATRPRAAGQPPPTDPPATVRRAPAGAPSTSCVGCHRGIESMHQPSAGRDLPADAAARGADREGLTCVDCHGGNGSATSKDAAHVAPTQARFVKAYAQSPAANPEDSYAALNGERPEFVRFMNPSDLRIAAETCGACHPGLVQSVRKSIMAHNGMVHNAVFYNNGAIQRKDPIYGETFDRNGRPAELEDSTKPSPEAVKHGAIEKLVPHPEFAITKQSDPLRVAEVNNPAGGTRAAGTDGRIGGTFLNVLKTRLNDPTLWMLGPNRVAGDYRSTGCASCHVIYANDASMWGSAQFAAAGNGGTGRTADAALAALKDKPGHPITHRLEMSIPTTQCLVCHYHQGDGAIGSFVGRIWWDGETDAEAIKKLGAAQEYGHGHGIDGMQTLARHNPELAQAQFSDFHGHGWNFVNVYKRDLKGALLDLAGQPIRDDDPQKWRKAVHLMDIHREKGMQCIDCHTTQDTHGDGNIYQQMTDYIEIRCVDCHGTVARPAVVERPGQRPTLLTSGHSWAPNNLFDAKIPFRDRNGERLPQFYIRQDNGRLYQRSRTEPGLEWQVKQVHDVVDPLKPDYNPRAAYAKLMRADGRFSFDASRGDVAHNYERMECSSCHSAWTTTCSGCHLPFDVNTKSKDKHYEDQESRGYAGYYSQVIRTDTFFLGIGTSNHGNKISPFRPASSVVVSAFDRNRNNTVHQQPLVSAPGYSNEAVTPHPPHTVRTKETRQCTDCHVSGRGDNNARMSLLLGFGANALNFVGTYAYIAEQGRAVTAVRVTEGNEPQPVIGSNFHRVLDDERYRAFEQRGRQLTEAYHRRAPNVRSVTVRGEYLFAAEGHDGIKVYDIANINNKAAAQRIVQASNSRVGERLTIPTPDATWVHLPSSLPMHVGGDTPVLNRTLPLPKVRELNHEQPIHDLYRYALITDSQDGLILVDVDTLTDGDPENNRLSRAVTFNEGGALNGARMVKNVGRYAYVVSDRTGLQIVDLEKPLAPRLIRQGDLGLRGARAIELQFRYAFVLDADGLKVLDITDREHPRAIPAATLRMDEARGITVSRTYAYIAAGKQGLVIVDVTHPEKPAMLTYDRTQAPLDDAYDVTVGATNASFFAYVADGRNGLKVVRLVEANQTPGHQGFAPTPMPKLIATYRSAGPAVAVARGQVRDRFVDEAGGQMVVTNRIGSRTFTAGDIRKFLYYPSGTLMEVDDVLPPELIQGRVRPTTALPSKDPAAATRRER